MQRQLCDLHRQRRVPRRRVPVCECELDADCASRNSACARNSCVAGKCVAASLAAGTACDDKDACTADDACTAAGVCRGANNTCPLAPADLVELPIDAAGEEGGGVASMLGAPLVCGGRGTCCRSKCVCSADWTGERCTRVAAPVTPPPTAAPTSLVPATVVDLCPRNPRKLAPGKCGCSVDDSGRQRCCMDRSVTAPRRSQCRATTTTIECKSQMHMCAYDACAMHTNASRQTPRNPQPYKEKNFKNAQQRQRSTSSREAGKQVRSTHHHTKRKKEKKKREKKSSNDTDQRTHRS